MIQKTLLCCIVKLSNDNTTTKILVQGRIKILVAPIFNYEWNFLKGFIALINLMICMPLFFLLTSFLTFIGPLLSRISLRHFD